MELNFTNDGKIKGCRIVNYLLEKSRLVNQLTNERNYHVFYMLLTDDELKKKLKLSDAAMYNYLNQSGCEVVEGRDDHEEYIDMMAAFRDLEFDNEHQDNIFECLAGMLNLGNLAFEPNPAEEDHYKVANPSYLEMACNLLGLQYDDVDKALCYKKMEVRAYESRSEEFIGVNLSYEKAALIVPITFHLTHSTRCLSQTRDGVIQIPLDEVKCKDQADALAKEIYFQIFDSLVRKVNDTIFKGDGDVGAEGTPLSIGVLDIYGFELFEVNSFEQLCINYANEKLQFFFNSVIFQGEMQMYESEGISCDQIDFQDNQPCLDLIEKKNYGILAKLDEEVRFNIIVQKPFTKFDTDSNTRFARSWDS